MGRRSDTWTEPLVVHPSMGGFRSLFSAGLLLPVTSVLGQQDSLFLSNGDIIVGEVKELTRSVATVGTEYSDSDLKIDRDRVLLIRTTSVYLVQLADGERYTASLHSNDSSAVALLQEGDTAYTTLEKIVFLKSVEPDLWSRASAAIDLGYNYTKANNLQQFSIRSALGYQTDRWMTSASFNKVRSSQDGVDNIQRTDIGATFRWALAKGYLVSVDANFLSNTEQLFDLRSSIQPSIGKYITRRNSMYLLSSIGGAYTREEYSTEDPVRRTFEGSIALELNLFDVGDVDLLLSAKAFPSFTEHGRWRMDHRFDVKYDLSLDLYIRAGLTLNCDNRPVTGAVETDYVLQTALGWEL